MAPSANYGPVAPAGLWALGGAPGVQSARYAGEPKSDARNNAKLVAAQKGVAGALRAAQRHVERVAQRLGIDDADVDDDVDVNIDAAPRAR